MDKKLSYFDLSNPEPVLKSELNIAKWSYRSNLIEEHFKSWKNKSIDEIWICLENLINICNICCFHHKFIYLYSNINYKYLCDNGIIKPIYLDDEIKNESDEVKFNCMNRYCEYIMFPIRNVYNSLISWSIPSKPAIEKIKEYMGTNTLLEIGCGFGFWAKMMMNEGIDVIPTGMISRYENPYTNTPSDTDIFISRCFIPDEFIEMSSADAIIKYDQAKCLFVSWGSCTFYEELLELFKGDIIIIIGEDEGGCTDYFDCTCTDFDLVEEFETPRFYCINDSMRIYKRI